MNTNNLYTKKIENQIHGLNTKIDHFQKRIEKLPRAANLKWTNVLDDIETKRSRLENRLESIKGASEDAYDDVNVGLKMAWEDLNIAYDSARERFEKELS